MSHTTRSGGSSSAARAAGGLPYRYSTVVSNIRARTLAPFSSPVFSSWLPTSTRLQRSAMAFANSCAVENSGVGPRQRRSSSDGWCAAAMGAADFSASAGGPPSPRLRRASGEAAVVSFSCAAGCAGEIISGPRRCCESHAVGPCAHSICAQPAGAISVAKDLSGRVGCWFAGGDGFGLAGLRFFDMERIHHRAAEGAERLVAQAFLPAWVDGLGTNGRRQECLRYVTAKASP
jgi:hypothetical protein